MASATVPVVETGVKTNLIKDFKRLVEARAIIRYLISQHLKSAHRDKLLGNIWMLLEPLLMMLVFLVAFSKFRHSTASFCLYVFSGLIAWDVFQKSLAGCTLCLRSSKGLIHKFPVPLAAFPVAIVLHKLNDFAWGLAAYCVLFGGLLLFSSEKMEFSWALLLLPIWVATYLLLVVGIGLLAASIGVFFRDMQDIVVVILRVGYFATPVFFTLDTLPMGDQSWYFLVNPIAGYLVYLRWILPGGSPLMGYTPVPVPYYPLVLLAETVIVFLLGFWIFQRGARHYSKYI